MADRPGGTRAQTFGSAQENASGADRTRIASTPRSGDAIGRLGRLGVPCPVSGRPVRLVQQNKLPALALQLNLARELLRGLNVVHQDLQEPVELGHEPPGAVGARVVIVQGPSLLSTPSLAMDRSQRP